MPLVREGMKSNVRALANLLGNDDMGITPARPGAPRLG
jgi:hypothetical protein